jgi:hypothetical protein
MNWSRRSTSEVNDAQASLGIDLNASRARAATGVAARNRVLLLDDPHPDLPLIISLEKRTAEIGRAGTALLRRLPHLTCSGFLPYLGQTREWKGGRHQFDATTALNLTFDKLRASCAGFRNFYFGLPAYLTLAQVNRIASIAAKGRFPLKGTVVGALAVAANRAGAMATPSAEADSKEEWVVPMHRGKGALPADVVIVDADEFALTASLIRVEPAQARILAATALPRCSVKLWKDRLLDALSDRCVRVCRRDPRDSAEAEQDLYQQIDDGLDRLRFGQKLSLTVRAAHWFQDLHLRSEDLETYCSGLVKQAVDGVRDLVGSLSMPEPPRAVWLTHEAGRLPGLGNALHQHMSERTSVGMLRPESVAVAVANLGERWQAGELPGIHLDTAIPISVKLSDVKPQTAPSVKTHR